MTAAKESTAGTYLEMNANELMELVYKMLQTIAHCDANKIEIPDEFLRAFGRVRDTLEHRCTGPDYSAEDFRKFFLVVLRVSKASLGLTESRVHSLLGRAFQSLQ